jgi:hypothetical protein
MIAPSMPSAICTTTSPGSRAIAFASSSSTAGDLSWLMTRESTETRLSRAAIEVLAIIAYHQPVTRAEIEESGISPLTRTP